MCSAVSRFQDSLEQLWASANATLRFHELDNSTGLLKPGVLQIQHQNAGTAIHFHDLLNSGLGSLHFLVILEFSESNTPGLVRSSF